MAANPDQMLLYHTAVKDWVETTFGSCIAGKTFTLMVGTPDRAFAEFVTPTPIDPDGIPPLPRAALTLGDPEIDPTRFNPHRIRKLGFTTGSSSLQLRAADYPVSIRIPFTLNFWTEWQREMNLYVQEVLRQFNPQYVYIPVDIDTISPVPVYGTKDVGLFIEGPINDTGDVEPGRLEEKVLRRTVSFYMNAWLWDLSFDDVYVVKEIVTKYYSDEDLTTLLETKSTPQQQTLVTSVNGTDTTFSPTINTNFLPVIQNTFLLDAVIGGVPVRGRDDGAGAIVDPISGLVSSGSIDYNTGAVSITYSSAPDAGTDITSKHFTTVTTIEDE